MDKSIVSLDSLLVIRRSTLDKYGIGFKKGDSSVHAGKKNWDEPKKLVENNTNRKSENQENK